jgi:GT2 family glycosyltransferase
MNPHPGVSFIVVNRDGGPLLADCLDSILHQTLDDFEVIVVDNGSTDGSWRAAEIPDPRFHLLRFDQNLGFAEANNRAIGQSRGRYVALVNNDATLSPGWAAAMVGALDADPHAGVAAGRTVQMRHPGRLDSAGFAFYSCVSCQAWKGLPADAFASGDHRPFGAVASAAVYRRAALDEVGLFHPEYFSYYEDTDLAVRLVLFGYDTAYVDGARARHLGSHTGKERSDFHVYHLRRNAEFVFWVDMVGSLAWRHLPFHLAHEGLAFLRAVYDGQAGVVLRAKLSACRHAGFILRERRNLHRTLRRRDGVRAARRRLAATMISGLPLRHRFAPPPASAPETVA